MTTLVEAVPAPLKLPRRGKQTHGSKTGVMRLGTETGPRNGPNFSKKSAVNGSRKRLSPTDREAMIVEEAVKFFAEAGFDGETRELARRAGITQPLLYRYFPTKKILIERVFESVFIGQWKEEWEDLLRDPRRPFEQRLVLFLQDYAELMLSYQWVRLFLFAGLAGIDASTEFMKRMRDRIFEPIIGELRLINHRPPVTQEPPNLTEHELVWGLIASLFYVGVRRWVYNLGVPEDIDALIEDKVRAFLLGAPAAIAARQTVLPSNKQLPSLYSRQSGITLIP